MTHDKVREAAISEVTKPTLELTKQFLEKNKVVVKDCVPVIADIVIDQKEKIAHVYFAIEDEDFYFVVTVDMDITATPSVSHMSPGSRVYFTAVTDDPNLAEMLRLIDFVPTLSWEKGQRRNNSSPSTYNHSSLIYEPIQKMTVQVEDKLNNLIDFLISRKEMIQHLSKLADIGIQVAYYGYKDQMWGIHLNKGIVKMISELGIYIDIDLYASGIDLGDTP